MSMLTARLHDLRTLIGEAYGVLNSDVSWERKHSIIFSEAVSGQIHKALLSLDLRLDDYYSGISYESAVKAYIGVLKDLERDIGDLYGPEGDYLAYRIDGRDYDDGSVRDESTG